MLVELIAWSFGMVAMLLTTWLQDRRDRREEAGRYTRLKAEYEKRISELETRTSDVETDVKELRQPCS